MPRVSAASAIATFSKLVSELLAERQACAARLAEIDGMFQRFGVSVEGARVQTAVPKAATPQPKAPGQQRKRKHYSQTSDQFILGLLQGGKGLTTAQINQAWADSGRRGLANTTLTLLKQAKKIIQNENKGGRGSIYSLP